MLYQIAITEHLCSLQECHPQEPGPQLFGGAYPRDLELQYINTHLCCHVFGPPLVWAASEMPFCFYNLFLGGGRRSAPYPFSGSREKDAKSDISDQAPGRFVINHYLPFRSLPRLYAFSKRASRHCVCRGCKIQAHHVTVLRPSSTLSTNLIWIVAGSRQCCWCYRCNFVPTCGCFCAAFYRGTAHSMIHGT